MQLLNQWLEKRQEFSLHKTQLTSAEELFKVHYIKGGNEIHGPKYCMLHILWQLSSVVMMLAIHSTHTSPTCCLVQLSYNLGDGGGGLANVNFVS